MFDHSENDRTDGLGHLSEIVRLVKILDWARASDRHQLADSIFDRLYGMRLSITVRDGWRAPGQLTDEMPEEFEILLATGGPAVRIYGELDHHGEPSSLCQLQNQDWRTPWQQVVPVTDEQQAALLTFCRCFHFAD